MDFGLKEFIDDHEARFGKKWTNTVIFSLGLTVVLSLLLILL